MKHFSVSTPRKGNVDFELLNQSEAYELTSKFSFEEIDQSIYSYRDDAPAIILENGWIIHKVLPKHYHKFATFEDFKLCHEKPNFYLVTVYDRYFNMPCYYYNMMGLNDLQLRKEFNSQLEKSSLYEDQFNVAYVDKKLGSVYFFFKPVRFALYWIENVEYFKYFIKYWKNEV